MPGVSFQPARCLRCLYVLNGLPSPGECPECGSPFDLADSSTFSTRPPLMRWVLWGPGLLASARPCLVVVGVEFHRMVPGAALRPNPFASYCTRSFGVIGRVIRSARFPLYCPICPKNFFSPSTHSTTG